MTPQEQIEREVLNQLTKEALIEMLLRERRAATQTIDSLVKMAEKMDGLVGYILQMKSQLLRGDFPFGQPGQG